MTTPRNPDLIVADWLDEGPTQMPSTTRRAIVTAVRTTPQARRGLGRSAWRPLMSRLVPLAGAAAVVVGIGLFAILAPQLPNGAGGPAVPPASASPTAAPSPSPSASPASPAPIPSIDPSAWGTYTSSVYGLQVGYPPDFRVDAVATRRWDAATDAALDFGSSAVDSFVNAAGQVGFSVWQVPVEPDLDLESREELTAWAETFCTVTGNAPCDGVADRAIQMCRERRDCHAAVIVPFREDVIAFFAGAADDTVSVVAVWRPDDDPSAAEYGGAIALLKGVLETMGIYPPEPGQIRP